MTLRRRLMWMLLISMAPLGLLAGVGIYGFVRSSLYSHLDDGLRARADALAAAVQWRGASLEFDVEDAALPEYQTAPGVGDEPAAFYEVWRSAQDDPGNLVARSKNLGSSGLLQTPEGRDQAPGSEGERSWSAVVGNGFKVRVLARHFTPSAEPGEAVTGAGTGPAPTAIVAVAVPRNATDRALHALISGLAVASAAFILAAYLATRWAVTRALAPVAQLADQVARIGPATLGSRLEVRPMPPEIAPIQNRVNELLARVGEAMEREKRFTSAAAHELRTPVAELRTALEVACSRPRPADEAARVLRTSLGVVEHLGRLVSALLRLTRVEAGALSVDPVRLVVSELLEESVHHAEAVAGPRGVGFHVVAPDDLVVVADADLLRLAIHNLVANAAEYADEYSTVELEANYVQPHVVVRISNSASTLAGANTGTLGEPFWRADSARTTGNHLGLGLTLARAALTACGGELELRIDRGGLVTLTALARIRGARARTPVPDAATSHT